MKDFKFDMSRGVKPNTEIIPPLHGSNISIPFNYGYLENTMVRPAHETAGQPTTKNISLPRKQENQHTQFNALRVPTGPSSLLPPLTSLEPPLRRLITAARDLFTERPIYTRRALFNSLPAEDLAIIGQNATKHIQQYVGYVFKDGPWSKAIIRFGVDPRKDPALRIYQTLTFNLNQKGESGGPNPNSDTVQNMGQESSSHIFDGTRLYHDGKMWQVCDITDPVLAQVFATADLRKKCHLEYDGWFRNGTLAKARVVMRHKLLTLREGESVDDKLFEKVVTLPESYDSTTASRYWAGYWGPEELSREERRLIEAVRTSANRSADGPVGRAGNGEMGTARDGDGDGDEDYEHDEGDEEEEGDGGDDGEDDEERDEEEEGTSDADGDGAEDENEGSEQAASSREEEEAAPVDPMLIDEDPDAASDDTETPASVLPNEQSTT
ncbi:hypothetical protein G7Y79_00006g018650 [Physcia stellaris]|nr:hypothetical protein G7Y79_00006g018650 [Physcia stellaris]